MPVVRAGVAHDGREVLARRDEAYTPDELIELLRDRLADQVLDVVHEYDTLTVTLDHAGYVAAAALCRDHDRLGYDTFDALFGVDARERGFEVVAVLYATEFGTRVLLKTLAAGGRDVPTCPTLTHLYTGADWHERETWDMFGIEFVGHPGLAPRILTVENFEGWPLRKDFFLASRSAKPWPGVKEPAELDDEGNVIERQPGPGDAPGPMELDKAMAEQAKLVNPAPEAPTTGRADAAQDPATREGQAAVEVAPEAQTAPDSEQVVAGPAEHSAEEAEQIEDEAKVDDAAATAADEATSATEQAGADDAAAEQSADAAKAHERADDQRRAAAKARANKAAERAAADRETSADGGDAPSVPAGQPQLDDDDVADQSGGDEAPPDHEEGDASDKGGDA